MNQEQLDKIDEGFALASDLLPDEQEEFLALWCGDDQIVLQKLRELLGTESPIHFPGFQHQVKQIGKYKIEKEIGEGGWGKVYLAFQEVEGVHIAVALKLLNFSFTDKQLSDRFTQERQILAELNHPNIAGLMDGGITEDGIPYIVMEYVDGIPLDRFCDENSLSIEERLRLFSQLCGAVQYIHQRDIVHRDLKPGNIYVTREGRVKLLDFGIAKLFGRLEQFRLVETQPGVMIGTDIYASPEQIKGGAIDKRSDIYSLGVILYELLTGHSPYLFQQRLREKIEDIIFNIPPLPPSQVIELVEEIPSSEGKVVRVISPHSVSSARNTSLWKLRQRLLGDLDHIILKALHKDPASRYASSYSLSEDVGCFLAGLPVSARPQTKMYIWGKWVRRHKVAASLILFYPLLLICGAHLFAKQYVEYLEVNDKLQQAKKYVVLATPVILSKSNGSASAIQAVEPELRSKFTDLLSEFEKLAETKADCQIVADGWSKLGRYLNRQNNGGDAEECFKKAEEITHNCR